MVLRSLHAISITHEFSLARRRTWGGSGKHQLADGLTDAPSAKPTALPLPPRNTRSSLGTRITVFLCVGVLIWSGSGCTTLRQGRDVIAPAKSLPATMPWDLTALNKPPKCEWLDREGPARSLYYEGPHYQDKPTRVFACYASPATLGSATASDAGFPGVVLVHGGGGTAFKEWVRLWDPSRYVGSAAMPVFFLNGTNDFAYPLDSYAKTYRLVQGQRNLRITVNMPHSHPDGWASAEIGLFIDECLKGASPLPVISHPSAANGRVRARVKAKTKLLSAALHYTTETGAINKRQWQTVPGTFDGTSIVTEAPPGDATVWFLTVTDERGGVVSSELVFPSGQS